MPSSRRSTVTDLPGAFYGSDFLRFAENHQSIPDLWHFHPRTTLAMAMNQFFQRMQSGFAEFLRPVEPPGVTDSEVAYGDALILKRQLRPR